MEEMSEKTAISRIVQEMVIAAQKAGLVMGFLTVKIQIIMVVI